MGRERTPCRLLPREREFGRMNPPSSRVCGCVWVCHSACPKARLWESVSLRFTCEMMFCGSVIGHERSRPLLWDSTSTMQTHFKLILRPPAFVHHLDTSSHRQSHENTGLISFPSGDQYNGVFPAKQAHGCGIFPPLFWQTAIPVSVLFRLSPKRRAAVLSRLTLTLSKDSFRFQL